jgi:hypothetical protein
LEEKVEVTLRQLNRGKQAELEDITTHFLTLGGSRNYYLYFVVEPSNKHPKTLKDFIKMIRYIGRGSGARLEHHGYNSATVGDPRYNDALTGLFINWRSKGQKAIGFRVCIDLTTNEASVFERAVLQAIGYWNESICNMNAGSPIKLNNEKWTPKNEAILGTQLLIQAFLKFISIPIKNHWHYPLENKKNGKGKTVGPTTIPNDKTIHTVYSEEQLLELWRSTELGKSLTVLKQVESPNKFNVPKEAEQIQCAKESPKVDKRQCSEENCKADQRQCSE